MIRCLAFVVCCLSFACVGKDTPPSNVIQPDSMRNVVWDMIQADQYVKLYLVKDSHDIDVKAETIRLYEEVFKIHHVTKEQFERSYRYYLAHQDLNKLIFDSISVENNRTRHQQITFPKPKLLPKAQK